MLKLHDNLFVRTCLQCQLTFYNLLLLIEIKNLVFDLVEKKVHTKIIQKKPALKIILTFNLNNILWYWSIHKKFFSLNIFY